ncbi:MAG: Omp28-related outer membrane protein, partial [Bacteroidales bacterium]|nr:Omp28-related outer membrane protein [Bacteroidales bacterium]
FTGHLCSNCPTQSLAAHELAEELDHRLVIVGIHAGGFSNLEPPLYTIDFTCPTGVKIHDDYQVNFYPSGLINRIVYGPSSVIPPQFWETIITDELDKPNVVDLSLQTYYYPNLKTIEINVLAEFKQQLEGKYKLSLYLVEDNIVAYQKNDNEELGPEDIPDYHHRNVLRDAVNGTYGVYVSDDGSITASVPYAQKFIYSDFSENWNIGNCKIIAFVYGEETDEVLQVAELAIHTGE